MKRPEKPSLSESLRVWAEEESARIASPSPTDQELFEYLEGGLSSARNLEIQEHIVLDPQVSARLLGLKSQLADGEAGEEAAAPVDSKDRHWQSIEKALGDLDGLDSVAAQEVVETAVVAQPHAANWIGWLAAGWFLTTVGLGFWIHQLRAPAAEGSTSLASQSGEELDVLAEAPMRFELVPEDRRRRSSGEFPTLGGEDINRPVLFSLVPSQFRTFESYRASLRMDSNQVMGPAREITRREGGGFLLILDAGTLDPGNYEIRVEGRSGGEWQELGIYRWRLGSGGDPR